MRERIGLNLWLPSGSIILLFYARTVSDSRAVVGSAFLSWEGKQPRSSVHPSSAAKTTCTTKLAPYIGIWMFTTSLSA